MNPLLLILIGVGLLFLVAGWAIAICEYVVIVSQGEQLDERRPRPPQ